MEPYELAENNLTGQEEYCIVDKAVYPNYLFAYFNPGDIHAGSYETAVMEY